MQRIANIVALAVLLALTPHHFISASQPPLIISAVQVSGSEGRTHDDFVELFNPNGVPANLNGYRLVKRTSSGTSDALLKSWTTDVYIAPYSFHLWANSGYIAANPDTNTNITISDNNGVALRFGANDTGVLLDSVSWGNSANSFNNVSSNNPAPEESLLRDNLFGEQSFKLLTHQPRNSATSPVLPEEGIVSDDSGADEAIEEVITSPEEESEEEVDAEEEVGEEGTDSESEDEVTAPSDNTEQNSPISEEVTNTAPVEPESELAEVVTAPVIKIRINELLPNPTGEDGGSEWIELYNDGEGVVNLKGYILDDISASMAVSSNAHTLPDLSINPGQYLVITLPSGKFTLNNTGGESVTLLNPQNQMVDTIAYTGTVLENQAYAYFEDGWLWVNPTKDQANQKPVSVSQVTSETIVTNVEPIKPDILELKLSEIYPSPKEGEQEFLELVNLGKTGSLSGYKIKVGSRVKNLTDLSAGKGEFVVLTGDDLPAQLSNSGQTVELISPFGEVIDAVTYPKANIGESLSRFEDNWLWSLMATPEKANELLLKKLDLEPFVAQASTLATSAKTAVKKTTAPAKPKAPAKATTKKTTSSPRSTPKVASANSTQQTSDPKKSDSTSQQPLNKYSWVLLAVMSVGGGMYLAYKYALKERWQF